MLLAALTAEEQLPRISEHGTAKSFLLARIAQALGMTCRFYNASLVNRTPFKSSGGEILAEGKPQGAITNEGPTDLEKKTRSPPNSAFFV